MMPQNLDLNLRHLSIYSLVQKEFLQNSFITENSYKCLEDPQRVNNVKSEILTEIIFLLGAAHLISSCFDFLCYNFIFNSLWSVHGRVATKIFEDFGGALNKA